MRRVASVLPSATESLCLIGGADLLVGRSHEDNFPPEITHLPILTGQKTTFTTAKEVDAQVSAAMAAGQSLYTLDVEKIKELRPDVILTQDICQVCAIDLQTVERVAASLNPPPEVVSLNPESVQDVLAGLLQIGDAVGMRAQAEAAHASLSRRVDCIDEAVRSHLAKGFKRPSVAFIEWPDPIYVGGHWTPQLIYRAGGRHPLNEGPGDDKGANGAGKSFAVHAESVVETQPDIVIVCPCGLDLPSTRREAARLQAMPWWADLPAVKSGRVYLVDGDAMFNRPGPRLIEALEWLASILLEKPQFAPVGFPFEVLTPKAADCGPPEVKAAEEAAAAKSAALIEIEEIHRKAVRKGEKTYIDPSTGYTVFTQLAMLERGKCCGSGCRHCPYDHQKVKPHRKAGLARPIVCEME